MTISHKALQQPKKDFLSNLSGALFLASIFSAPVYFGSVHLWFFSIVSFLAAISSCFLVFEAGKLPEFSRSEKVLFFLFFVFYTVSAFFSRIPAVSAVETYKLAACFLIFFLTCRYCSSRKNVENLCMIIAFFGGALSFFGLLQYVGALPKIWWHVPHFLSSVYVNHNHFAGLLQILFFTSAGYFIAEKSVSKKYFVFFMCVLMLAAYIFTLSRGGYLALASGALFFSVFFIFKKRSRLLWVFAILILILGALLLWVGIDPVTERVLTLERVAEGDISAFDRPLIWKAALSVASENLWFGTGPGTFEYAFLAYRPIGFLHRPVFAHSDLIQLLSDCGVFVFFCVLGLLFVFLFRGIRNAYKSESLFVSGVSVGCASAMVAFFVHALIDFNFHIPANQMWFFVSAAMLFSVGKSSGDYASHNAASKRSVMIFLTIAALLGSVFFGISDFFLWRAKNLKNDTEYLRNLNKSLSMNPFNHRAFYLRGLSKEKEEAALDLDRASKLNSLEPFYAYHAAKKLLETENISAAAAMALYKNVLKKDPNDLKLSYLIASDFIKKYPVKEDAEIYRWLKELLAKSALLGGSYKEVSYRTLWVYAGRPSALSEYLLHVSDDPDAVLWFLKLKNYWRSYREFFLKRHGMNFEKRIRDIDDISWEEKPAYTLFLKDFSTRFAYEAFSGELLFTSGRLFSKLKIEKRPCLVRLRARGAKAGEAYPFLVLDLDKNPADGIYVDSPFMSHFYGMLDAPVGDFEFGVEFVNDYADKKSDRNVWIDRIEIYYPRG